jgi:GMP synthase (glutamine-hydrolysing)
MRLSSANSLLRKSKRDKPMSLSMWSSRSRSSRLVLSWRMRRTMWPITAAMKSLTQSKAVLRALARLAIGSKLLLVMKCDIGGSIEFGDSGCSRRFVTSLLETGPERFVHVAFNFKKDAQTCLDRPDAPLHRSLMSSAILVSHDPAEREDERVSKFLKAKDFNLLWSCPAMGDPIPPMTEEVQALVVLGGKYGVPDKDSYAFLKDEMRIIRDALRRDIPILGICLGAQLLAHELGADVGPHPRGLYEYGFYPLIPSEEGSTLIPMSLMALQSHYHQFQIPRGAHRLASSELYENQAFRYGDKAFGLQFHPEASLASLKRWIARRGERNYASGAHPPERQLADYARYDLPLGQWFNDFLEKWIAPVREKSKAA